MILANLVEGIYRDLSQKSTKKTYYDVIMMYILHF